MNKPEISNILLWSKNGVGANSWLAALEDYFEKVAVHFHEKDMLQEAELFDEVLEELKKTAEETRRLSKD